MTTVESRTGVGGTPLERDGLLRALNERFEHAERGRGGLVLLGGEAGIGKTAVVRSLAGQVADRARVLTGGCDPLSTPRPLGPVLDIVDDLAPAVEDALDAALAGAAAPSGVFRALLADLVHSVRPTVLVVEDLHWADGATCDLLRYLNRRIEAVRVLLVATYRDDEVGPGHPLTAALGDLTGCAATHRWTIDPLSPSAVARMAAGTGLDAGRLHEVTGGNPFFVTEVLRAGDDRVPESVREVVLGRLARASDGVRAVAEAVAVIGSRAPLDVVRAVCPEAAGCQEEALASGVLLARDHGLAFRHELARMAVYEATPGYRRQDLHARVLAVLPAGSGADLGRLAHHAEEAGDGAAVIRYAPEAGVRAMALGAYREAAAQYGRALRHAVGVPADRAAELLESRAYAHYLTGLVPAALDSWRPAAQIRRTLADHRRQGDDLRWSSYMLWLLGRNEEAREAGLRAVRLLTDAGAGPELARAYGNLAEQASYDCDLAATERFARRAVEVGGEHGEAGVVLRARFSAAIARVLARDEAWDELDAVWALAAEDPAMVQHAGMFAPVISAVAVVHRDFRRADRFAERAVGYCRDHDLDMFLDYLRGARSAGLLHRGEWDRAADEATAALRLCSLPPVSRIFPLVSLGLVRARRGDPDGRPLIDEAAASGDPVDLIRLAPAWAAQAEASWLAGDDAAAVERAGSGLAAAKPGADPWALGGLARWVVLAGGDPPDVPAAGPFALELAGRWQAAARAWEALGCGYDAALARLAGDRAALTQALTTFEHLGARPAAARARARLKAMGARLGTRGPRAATGAHPHGLTRRQAEVFDLVREGLTDVQIAARLYLSQKTVNHHVMAVLAKLGVHSRADAVRATGDGSRRSLRSRRGG